MMADKKRVSNQREFLLSVKKSIKQSEENRKRANQPNYTINKKNKPEEVKPVDKTPTEVSKTVSIKQLNKFRKDTNNPKAQLRDFFNANKFDKTKGFVPRAKPLKRITKNTNLKVEKKVKPAQDKRVNQSNYFDNRARTQSSYYPNSQSTRGRNKINNRVIGTSNVATQDYSKKINPEDAIKRGSLYKKGGSVKIRRCDGIAKKGKTKGRII
jgi:hypothetical protein